MLGVEVAEFKKAKGGSPRDFVVITNESIQKECLEFRQMTFIVDVTAETKPFGVATFTVPEASGDFCKRGLRFGPHNVHEMRPGSYQNENLIFITYYNAGLRVFGRMARTVLVS